MSVAVPYFAFTLLFLLSTVPTTSQKPNIVYVLFDDVGWADFSYNNPQKIIPTPFLDELSSEGVRLDQHYVHPTCTPSRASFMTGRYSVYTGLSFAMLPGSPVGLPPDIPTLPQLMRKQGYHAHMVGKWHLGHSQWLQTPVGRGFESHVGCFMWDIDSYTKQMYSSPWEAGAVDWIRAFENKTYHHFAEPRHATIALTDEAQQVLRAHASQKTQSPLFLYLAYTAAHSPLQPSEEHLSKCLHIPNHWRRQFCGMVVGLDEGVRNLTETIRSTLGENTVMVVTSDNGGSTWFGGANYPFRSGKTTPFEGGVRVPTFVVDFTKDGRYFGKKGRHYNGMIHISDWLPTFLSLAGSSQEDVPEGLNGVNIATALRLSEPSPRQDLLLDLYDKGQSVFPEEFLVSYRRGPYKLIQGVVRDPHWYFEPTTDHLNSSDLTWVVTTGERVIKGGEYLFGEGKWDPLRIVFTHKLFHSEYVKPQLPNGNTYLYNIENDPSEIHNLASELPEVVQQLEAHINSIRSQIPPSQQYWRCISHDTWFATFVPGDCSSQPNLPPEQCRFTHPWLSDEVDIRAILETYADCGDPGKLLRKEAGRLKWHFLTAIIVGVVGIIWLCRRR